MTSQKARQIVLASRPVGKPELANFRIEDTDIPVLGEGQVLLEILYLSLDPYMRGRMSDAKSYAAPTPIGGVMGGATVASVIGSNHADYAVGDTVLSYSGWRTHALTDGSDLRKLDPELAPVTTALGVLGMPGLTAYGGLYSIGKPKERETVVVAAASGPVGCMVGQLASIAGARTVGIAGGPNKCTFVKNDLKFDEAIDRHASDFADQLAAACPNGIDVYFENVGGAVWQAVLPLLNYHARVPVCGLIAQYNGPCDDRNDGLVSATMRQVLTKSLTIQGYIVTEFFHLEPIFLREVGAWIADGRIRYREDIVEGLENAPGAFIGLLDGKNFGKLIVKLGPAIA